MRHMVQQFAALEPTLYDTSHIPPAPPPPLEPLEYAPVGFAMPGSSPGSHQQQEQQEQQQQQAGLGLGLGLGLGAQGRCISPEYARAAPVMQQALRMREDDTSVALYDASGEVLPLVAYDGYKLSLRGTAALQVGQGAAVLHGMCVVHGMCVLHVMCVVHGMCVCSA
jgi:hypothetical protein